MRKFALRTAVAAVALIPAVAPVLSIATPAFAGDNSNEVHFPPPLPPAPAPSSSGAWVRPYSTNGNDAGAVGGYQTPGGTSFTGNIHVPTYGPPSGGFSVTIPTR